MEIRIRKSTIIYIIIILILLALLGMMGYEFINMKQNNNEEIEKLENQLNTLQDKKKNQNTSVNEDKTLTTSNEKQKLTEEELDEVTQFLNISDNNGFVLCEYDNIENVRYPIIIGCAFMTSEYESEEANKRYCELFDLDSYEYPLYKFTLKDAQNLFKTKTEIIPSNLEFELNDMGLAYDDVNNTYYIPSGENYAVKVKAVRGIKQGEKYVISGNYETPVLNNEDNEVNKFTVTMKKATDGFIFISNKMN